MPRISRRSALKPIVFTAFCISLTISILRALRRRTMTNAGAGVIDATKNPDEPSARLGEEFLLADFEALRELRANLNTLVTSEINVFLTMVTATFVALGFLGDRISFGERFRLLALGVLLVVCLLGIITFARVVESRIQVHSYARSMNRIRRYFFCQSMTIAPYLDQRAVSDALPRYAAIGQSRGRIRAMLGNTGMIATLNSATLAAFGVILAILLGYDENSVLVTIALVLFVVGVGSHEFYQHHRYADAEKRDEPAIRFPPQMPC
jgi:hypothetical protein